MAPLAGDCETMAANTKQLLLDAFKGNSGSRTEVMAKNGKESNKKRARDNEEFSTSSSSSAAGTAMESSSSSSGLREPCLDAKTFLVETCAAQRAELAARKHSLFVAIQDVESL